MAKISRATLTIRLSSSYVLIIATPSAGFSERVGARPPATRVNTLFCLGAPAALGVPGRVYWLENNYVQYKKYYNNYYGSQTSCIGSWSNIWLRLFSTGTSFFYYKF